jgi:hypothetical protein
MEKEEKVYSEMERILPYVTCDGNERVVELRDDSTGDAIAERLADLFGLTPQAESPSRGLWLTTPIPAREQGHEDAVAFLPLLEIGAARELGNGNAHELCYDLSIYSSQGASSNLERQEQRIGDDKHDVEEHEKKWENERYYGEYSNFDIHLSMLHDEQRCSVYRRALDGADLQGKVVLDVGCALVFCGTSGRRARLCC